MIAFFKLIRWPNIIMMWMAIGLTQFCVVNPVLGLHRFEAGLNGRELLLLVMATTFIAMAGYLWNDLHDINPDSVNKPEKNLVGKRFRVHTVKMLYWVFNVLGITSGAVLSYLTGHVNFSLIFILTAGLLWFYSNRYQCQPLTGNVVVAFLSALTIGLVWLFNFIVLVDEPGALSLVQPMFTQLNVLILIFSGFAFITSLLREMIKDLQDLEGDDRFGCRTLAVVLGIEKAKCLTMFVLVAAFLLSLYAQWYFVQAGYLYLFYFFLVIDLLFLGVIFRLAKARSKENFKAASFMVKILMLAGMFSMILVYFEF